LLNTQNGINILNLYVAHCCVFLFILLYIVVYFMCFHWIQIS